jgi:hypothetical protein
VEHRRSTWNARQPPSRHRSLKSRHSWPQQPFRPPCATRPLICPRNVDSNWRPDADLMRVTPPLTFHVEHSARASPGAWRARRNATVMSTGLFHVERVTPFIAPAIPWKPRAGVDAGPAAGRHASQPLPSLNEVLNARDDRRCLRAHPPQRGEALLTSSTAPVPTFHVEPCLAHGARCIAGDLTSPPTRDEPATRAPRSTWNGHHRADDRLTPGATRTKPGHLRVPRGTTAPCRAPGSTRMARASPPHRRLPDGRSPPPR